MADPIDGLLTEAYAELRRIAGAYMRRERPGQTLQPTALVHEAYVRLARQHPPLENRAHFCAIAARAMREILIERARARNAGKRGGGAIRVTFDEGLGARGPDEGLDLEAVDEALTRLAAIDARQARIVELRFFGGLNVEETAAALGISAATVKRDWSVARAWLARELLRT
jgi:RNA polymerase sigma-70 factor (ECF subfamily)